MARLLFDLLSVSRRESFGHLPILPQEPNAAQQNLHHRGGRGREAQVK